MLLLVDELLSCPKASITLTGISSQRQLWNILQKQQVVSRIVILKWKQTRLKRGTRTLGISKGVTATLTSLGTLSRSLIGPMSDAQLGP